MPTQLIWDGAVNPYGAAANINAEISEHVHFFTNTGILALTEYRDHELQTDIPMNSIFIIQSGIETKRGNINAKGAITVQQFSLTNHGTNGWIKADQAYTLINPAWNVRLDNLVSSCGLNFTGEYSRNVNSNADHDTEAYMLSFGFGNASLNNFKTWQVAAAYRRVEEHAIPLGFGDSSVYNTDPSRGWEYSAGLGLLKNLSFTAKFFNMTDIDGNRAQLVSQFDVVYKF